MMERLSTLYNADVGLYMLANKVRSPSLTHDLTSCIYSLFDFSYFLMALSTIIFTLGKQSSFVGVLTLIISLSSYYL